VPDENNETWFRHAGQLSQGVGCCVMSAVRDGSRKVVRGKDIVVVKLGAKDRVKSVSWS
jgi:hypothetical protein